MAISLKHAFESAIADGVDDTVVQPSDWNAEHTLTMATSRVLGRITAGTGAAEELTAAQVKALLDLEIGTDVQAWSTHIDAVAALAKTDGNIIVGDGTTFVAESGATARTSLGVGTGDSPQFTGVNVGHATDTTITRVGAGVIAVEGDTVGMLGTSQTWTGTPTRRGGTTM